MMKNTVLSSYLPMNLSEDKLEELEAMSFFQNNKDKIKIALIMTFEFRNLDLEEDWLEFIEGEDWLFKDGDEYRTVQDITENDPNKLHELTNFQHWVWWKYHDWFQFETEDNFLGQLIKDEKLVQSAIEVEDGYYDSDFRPIVEIKLRGEPTITLEDYFALSELYFLHPECGTGGSIGAIGMAWLSAYSYCNDECYGDDYDEVRSYTTPIYVLDNKELRLGKYDYDILEAWLIKKVEDLF